MLIESSVTGANRGCEPGTSSSFPENGTIGTAYISTGGGSPGSSVRGQYGNQDAVPDNNRIEEGELNAPDSLQVERTGTGIRDPNHAPLGATGDRCQNSTASVTLITARRDEDGRRDRTRSEGTGTVQDYKHRRTEIRRAGHLSQVNQLTRKPDGKLRSVRQPFSRQQIRKKYINRLSHLLPSNLKYVPHQIFIMFDGERWLRDIEAGRWPPPPKPKVPVNNEEAHLDAEAESDSEISSSNGSTNGFVGRRPNDPQTSLTVSTREGNTSGATMPPKKKITAAEESAKREESFRHLCETTGVDPDTSSASSDGEMSITDHSVVSHITTTKVAPNDEPDWCSDEEDERDRPYEKVQASGFSPHPKTPSEEEDRDKGNNSKLNMSAQSPSRPLSGLTVVKSPIHKHGSSHGKRSQAQQHPHATPSKTLKEKPTSWSTPPSNQTSDPGVNRPVSSPHPRVDTPDQRPIDSPRLDTPKSEQESAADESSVSTARKNLSFAPESPNNIRYYDNRNDPPVYDSGLDGSESSSQSGTAEFRESDRMQEDDDVDEDDQAEELILSVGSRSCTQPRPEPVFNHTWLEILPVGAERKELGGNGACLLLSICHARYGSIDGQDHLRLAIMGELENNKKFYQPFCVLENSKDTMPISEYVKIHSKKEAYCGYLEIRASCNILKADIRVYSRHYVTGYQDFIYVNELDPPASHDMIEIAHIPDANNTMNDHYNSVVSQRWTERMGTMPQFPSSLKKWNRVLGNLPVSSTGTLYDKEGVRVEKETVKQVIRQGTGILHNGLTWSNDHILIVGRYPSRSIVEEARTRGITLTTWPQFVDLASGRDSEEDLRAASKNIQVEAYRGDKRIDEPVQAGPTPTLVCTEMTDRFAQTKIHGNAEVGGGLHPEQSEPRESNQHPMLSKQLSSALKPSNREIPIDRGRLQRDESMNKPIPPRATPTGNCRPTYANSKISYVQLLQSHTLEEDDAKPDDLRKALKEVYRILSDHDRSITLHPSYNDSPNAPAITDIQRFPTDWSQMLKYIHIKNPYSLRPPWTDNDGNKRAQSATIGTLIMSSTTDLGRTLTMLSSCFMEFNIRLTIKGIDALDERNVFAIMGLSNLFDNAALKSVILRELNKKVEEAHEQGLWKNHDEGWEDRETPTFQLLTIKAKVPPETEEITPAYREAMETFTAFRYYTAILMPDHEVKFGIECFHLLKNNSTLKEALSRCVSLVEIPPDGSVSTAYDQLYRRTAYHWGFNHKHTLTEMFGVLSTTVRVKVRLENGQRPPYKQTNLARELKRLMTGTNCEGGVGKFLIEGFLLVHGQTMEGGKLQISHANSRGTRELVNNLADTPAAFFYQILTRTRGFSQKCALELINKSFNVETRQGASRSTINLETLIVTPQRRSQNSEFERNMGARGITLEIPKDIKDQMERKARESEVERTRLHEQLAEDLGVKHHPNQDFSEIGSKASAVTGMSQSTDGRNTYRTYDTGEVKGEYFSKSDELLRLTIKLREMDPDNVIFEKPGYRVEDDELSLTSLTDIEMAVKFSAMRQQINQLHQTIREVEQLSTTCRDGASEATTSRSKSESQAVTLINQAENDSKTEEARKSRELAATKGTMISKALVGNPTTQDVDMEDGPAEIRGGGEDDEESGEKKITHLYPNSDDDSAIEEHDTEEVGEFEENFLSECRYHERLLSEYRAQEDQEIDESQGEEELQEIASAWYQNGFVVARDSPTNIDDPMNDRLVVLPSREVIRRIEESGLDPSFNQGHEEDSGEGEKLVGNRSGAENEVSVDAFRWFGRWKNETKPREWTKEEVAPPPGYVEPVISWYKDRSKVV